MCCAFPKPARWLSLVVSCALTSARIRRSSSKSWPKDGERFSAIMAAYKSASTNDDAVAFWVDDQCLRRPPLCRELQRWLTYKCEGNPPNPNQSRRKSHHHPYRTQTLAPATIQAGANPGGVGPIRCPPRVEIGAGQRSIRGGSGPSAVDWVRGRLGIHLGPGRDRSGAHPRVL